MKDLLRLVVFIRPLRHYIPEYVIYILVAVLFGAINFTMLIPVFDMLFQNQQGEAVEPTLPLFEFSIDYFTATLRYYLFTISANHSKLWALSFICGLILLFSIINNTFKYLSARVAIRMKTSLANNIREALYQKFLEQSMHYHTKTKMGELISVITVEVHQIEQSVVNAFQSWIRDPFIIIIYFSILFYLSFDLTIFTIIFFPIAGMTVAYIMRRLRKVSTEHQKWISQSVSTTEESLQGVKIIQSYSATNFFVARFRDINKNLKSSTQKLFRRQELAGVSSETMGVAIVVVLVLYGGYLLIKNTDPTFTAAVFVGYLAVYSQIISPLKAVTNTTSLVQRGVAASKKIFDVLDTPSSIVNAPNAISKKTFDTELVLKNVSFSYNEKNRVIKNINLTVRKGESVAFVGESGSGKTTLCNLINRFYEPTEGSIFIDDVSIQAIKLDDLRRLISYVSQENILFHDTIMNNIAFAKDTNKNKEKIKHAASMSFADRFIEESKYGYNTLVGEKGMKLSGGQRQRLTIARALFKNAPIFILDEATSALDSKSENYVQQAIEQLMQTKTSIIIAHRLSTVKNADRIIVMSNGEIVEQGTHAQLLGNKNGHYTGLVEAQSLK